MAATIEIENIDERRRREGIDDSAQGDSAAAWSAPWRGRSSSVCGPMPW